MRVQCKGSIGKDKGAKLSRGLLIIQTKICYLAIVQRGRKGGA